MILCDKCNKPRPGGRICQPCNMEKITAEYEAKKQKRAEQQKKYNQSDKGKLTAKRYLKKVYKKEVAGVKRKKALQDKTVSKIISRHREAQKLLQRFLDCIETGSYGEKHLYDDKWNDFIKVLKDAEAHLKEVQI